MPVQALPQSYSREWMGHTDNLAKGVEPEDYRQSCLRDPPAHPTTSDPRTRGLVCLKWMLLWGDYLASYESGGLEGKEVEVPRGRRYLIDTFELLRRDLENTPPGELAARMQRHNQLEFQVRWVVLVDDGPQLEPVRRAALDYYLTVWNILPRAPQSIEPFEYKFWTGEQIKWLLRDEIVAGTRESEPRTLTLDTTNKLLAFLESAFAFHQLSMPAGDDPKGRHFIEADLTNDHGIGRYGIGYGVFPDSAVLQELPMLANTDLRASRNLLQAAVAAHLITDAEADPKLKKLDDQLFQRRVAGLEAWIERLSARGDRLAALDRRIELRTLYGERADRVAQLKQQEIICAQAREIDDRALIARETITRGLIKFVLEDYRGALADLTASRDAALETGQGDFLMQGMEVSEAARSKLGLAAQSTDDARFLNMLAADAKTLPGHELDENPKALIAALRQWRVQPGHLPGLRAAADSRLAVTLVKIHEYAEAEGIFDDLIPRLHATRNKTEEFASLTFLLRIEDARANLGRYYATLSDFERLGEELHGQDRVEDAGLDIAQVLFRTRDLSRAESVLRQHIDATRLAVLRSPDTWIYGAEDAADYESLALLTRIDLERGRVEEAAARQPMLERWAQAGITKPAAGVDATVVRRKQLRVLMGLARIDFEHGDLRAALGKTQQALPFIAPLADMDFWVDSKLLEARSMLGLSEDVGDAVRRFEQLAPHFTEYKELGAGRAVDMEIFLADYYTARSDAAPAARWLGAAGKLAAELGLIDQQIEVHRKLGDLALRGGDPKLASAEYRQAVQLVSAVSRSIPTDLAKVGYRGERSRAVAALVWSLYDEYRQSPRPELLLEMFKAVEEGKSRALIEMVYSAQGAPPRAFDPHALQSRLPQDVTVVEYYVPEGVRDAVLRFVLDKSTINVDSLTVGAKELETRLKSLKDEAIDSAESYDEPGFRGRAAALGRVLLPPVLLTAQPARRVFVVPTGSLYLFPFGLLADDEGRFLAENEHIELAYLPNAALAARPAPRLEEARRMAAYVNPALDQELSSYLTGNSRLRPTFEATLRGWNAQDHWQTPVTREELVVDAQKTDNVFLYAHGRFVPEDPTRSYIRLADQKGAPTVLSAEELLQLRIGAGLWVLAACSSGSGDVRSGDEVLGLPRSMLEAGASMVVISLWDVGQVPNWQMMNSMMRKISAHESTAQALREAQAELRQAGRPPYDWAAFILTGQHGYAH
jgi:CHAT domain-containing protein